MKFGIKLALSRLLRKSDGSAIIEFAIVAPVFFILFFGLVEFSLYMYHKMAIERISSDVSRLVSIGKTADANGPCANPQQGTPLDQVTYIKCAVREKARGLINGDRVKVQINRLINIGSGNNEISTLGTSLPDICLDDETNPNSEVPTCTRWEDVNGNNVYDPAKAIIPGVNGQNMEIRIYYPWSVQIPLLNKFFGSTLNKGIVMIDSTTVFKNEPM